MKVPLATVARNENERIAARLRDTFAAAGTLSLSFIGSVGCGKTSLLEKTLERLPLEVRAAVLTADPQTDNDARRLGRCGCPARQIMTAGVCHLNPRMVEKHLQGWRLAEIDLLLIENVGNLICPAGYDLGEDAKVVVLSLAEGEDTPLKYPELFQKAQLMILNKIDLLPYAACRPGVARENASRINPEMEIIETSCTVETGLDQWMNWLLGRMALKAPAAAFTGAETYFQGGRPLTND